MPELHWSDERIEKLKTLYATGVSFKRIAASLGHVSRNACIGKCARLVAAGKLEKRAELTGYQRAFHLRESKPKRIVMVKDDVHEQAPQSLRISLLDIRDGMCRFISSDPLVDSSMCGHTADGTLCAFHHDVCYDKVKTAAYTARVHKAREDRRSQ
jgi:hypothetical protein